MNSEQAAKQKVALGDLTLWPVLTDDPEVNYEIDRAISEAIRNQAKMPPWEDAPLEVRLMYEEETVFFKKEPEIRRPPPGLVY